MNTDPIEELNEEIRRLKEENEKLKKEIRSLKNDYYQWSSQFDSGSFGRAEIGEDDNEEKIAPKSGDQIKQEVDEKNQCKNNKENPSV